MSNVTRFPDVFVGDYDPVEFPRLVADELEKRAPLVASIVLAIDSTGHYTLHTSSTDENLNNLLLRLAERHTFEELCDRLEYGFSSGDEEEPVKG